MVLSLLSTTDLACSRVALLLSMLLCQLQWQDMELWLAIWSVELHYSITSSLFSWFVLSTQTATSLRNQKDSAGIFTEAVLHLAQG